MEKKKNGEEESIRDKIDKKMGVLITHGDDGTPFVSMPCSQFPYEFWKEWETDCKKRFRGNRWMKLWHDHGKVKQFNLEVEVEMLKSALVEATKEQQEMKQEKETTDDNPLGLMNPDGV